MSDETVKRPGGLTAICILSLVIGSLGFCCNMANGAGLVFTDRMQRAQRGLVESQQDPMLRHAQEESMDQAAAVVAKWAPYVGVITFLQVILSVLLLAGGGLALALKSGGRLVLMVASVLGPVVEITTAVVKGLQQVDTRAIMTTALSRGMQVGALEHGGGPPPPTAFAGPMMNVASSAGIAVAGTWALALTVFYVVMAIYLRKPEVRALYG